ncbi:MAG: hypothetical protein K0S23_3068 [Fluviicola sp.]|jgi:hypothetical protein|uniref:hypothetical protein n=1 Tax=Fluviicola sp. TaxID=1917219 RepID=UPI0026221881|nr:hypothetical protein [Fluviicola sp.]MDF3028761.1 hypothetical protein [Fluviicola sp.]
MILSKLKIFLPAFLIFGPGCSDPAPKKNQIKTIETVVPKTEAKDSFIVDHSVFPIRILTTGIFHNDEIPGNAGNMEWVGLFKTQDGYYLSEAKVTSVPVHDPVLDENESIMTGWEVSTREKDTSILLMQTLPYLAKRKIKAVKLSKKEIYPGEKLSFNYLGIDYELSASGNKKKENPDSDWYIVSNYKLYLSAKIDGRRSKTLLSSHQMFDDAMVALIFAGDIDGDGILDLILDNANHYNVTDPTLFFSRPAGKGQVVKKAGSFMSVGC